ncbi:PaaI family thioesterase [Marinospirillum sp. MEB164]|uniref:PaaI family thioesterase n=1 Tax=Marinospirillum alkalitolerans TaxID=3123374 RepID=A0ABW8PY39_9GAMM
MMTPEQQHRGIAGFMQMIPHCKEIGMSLDHIQADSSVVLRLDPRPELTGNATLGLIHGGVLTVLMDTACGSAAILGLPYPEICPTVDLRLDHYSAANNQRPLFCRAWATHVTQQIVFTEGVIWQDEGQLLAKGTGTFMRLGAERTPAGFAQHLFGVEPQA